MNPAPCAPVDARTSALTVRTGWGGGVVVRRRYGAAPSAARYIREAWWVYCEGARRWRLCEPDASGPGYPGDLP